MTTPIRFTLNGAPVEFDGPAGTPLIDLLREHFGLRGVRLACARGVCGSCTVLIDGAPAAACSLFAYRVDGCDVATVEGLAETDPVATAFADHAAFQCGYCTGGMIMLATALLAHDPDPSRDTVVAWMSSNICRCTGYGMIIEAVLDAATRLREARDAA
jgi:carbon-monoxide dehydrogenase small subunit